MRSSLNVIVPTVLLLSVVPAAVAWRHGSAEKGKVTDSDFFQTITGSVLQVLSLVTFVWPTFGHPRLSMINWFWIWLLAGFSVLCALISSPLYLLLPTTWSFLVAFTGAISQSVILLQVVNKI